MNTYKAIFVNPADRAPSFEYVFEALDDEHAKAHLKDYIMNKPSLSRGGYRLKGGQISRIGEGVMV